ncbi:O-antigen translocase [Budvicia diplopodorum]|uniref:O-antigen translocase n=1 Tax=Budvicia diplopodorum TaxID=1119056 RepID=UPI001FE51C8C|nr:O-antigen translocase [Budvicia diplopodorum]
MVISSTFSILFSHGIKILYGLVLLKLIAVYLGPDGLGELGNFMSLVTIFTVIAGGGVINGIIKYVAEYKNTPDKLYGFIYTSLVYSICFSIVVLILSIIFSNYISILIFGNDKYSSVIIFAALSQIILSLVNVIVGIVNGYRNTVLYAKITIFGYIISFPVVYFFIKYSGYVGAAKSLVVASALMILPAIIFCFRYFSLNEFKTHASLDSKYLKDISKFSLMLLVSVSTFPISEIIIRNIIIENVGLANAGIWQSLTKLSAVYMGFIGIFLNFYFMPLLSEKGNDISSINRIVIKFSCIILISFFCTSIFFYFLRSFIISLVFSKEFLVAGDFIIYQLIGDFFRVGSYIIGFIVVAKAATKLYIFAEILQCTLYVSIVYFSLKFSSGFELSTVFKSYIYVYMIYLLVCYLVYYFWYKNRRSINVINN